MKDPYSFYRSYKLLPFEIIFSYEEISKINNILCLDLVNIFTSVFYTDISIPINNNEVRNIEIEVPVSSNILWNSQKKLIESLLNFVTEDKWKINFFDIDLEKKIYTKNIQLELDLTSYDNVTLLSGGLDSFCGAYVNTMNNIQSMYCGYFLNNFEVSGMRKVVSFLSEINIDFSFREISKLRCKKTEPSQRTRSLFFLGLAAVIADINSINTINLYENGIMSLNPELNSRRTTKTTHPKTIWMFNKLLSNLDICLKIEHPFLFKTKSEIIKDLSKEFSETIKDTMTCGASRQNKYFISKVSHCGVCAPCILRKISISNNDMENIDSKYQVGYNTSIEEVKDRFPEYRSSLQYYKTYSDYIRNGKIFEHLVLNKKYYSDPSFLEHTKNMLDRFSSEVEYFFSKYPLI